jgi:hypothetical protein
MKFGFIIIKVLLLKNLYKHNFNHHKHVGFNNLDYIILLPTYIKELVNNIMNYFKAHNEDI